LVIRRLPPLNSIRIFEAAARNESFVAAAEELAVTASAVSHQVKTLEQFLGLELFRRNKRKVELTPMGEQYLVSIKYALDEIEVATKRLTANPETDIVTISVAPNFLTRWLMPRMQRFQERFPDVELQISASTGLIDFNKSNTDMAIYFGHGDWHDIEVHFLRKVLLVPVCSPTLINSARQLTVPEDLRKHTLIQVSKRLYEWQEWLQLAGVEYSGFGRGLQLSSSQLATAAAQEGLGVALADSTLTSREIKEGKLIMPFDIMLNTHKSFYLVHKKNRSLTYGMRAFKDWVIEEMHKSCV
jgi:LysR family glycine cleavage system transcriptional activator